MMERTTPGSQQRVQCEGVKNFIRERELGKPTWQDAEMSLASNGVGCGSVADICGAVSCFTTGDGNCESCRPSDGLHGVSWVCLVTRPSQAAHSSLRGWQAVVSLGHLQARTKSSEVKVTSLQLKDRQAKHVVREVPLSPPRREHFKLTP